MHKLLNGREGERESARSSVVWSLLMFAHLARIIWIKTRKYKTIDRGIHYKLYFQP